MANALVPPGVRVTQPSPQSSTTRTRPSPAPPRSAALYRGGCSTDADLAGMVDTTGWSSPAEHRATYERLQTQFVAAFEALRPISPPSTPDRHSPKGAP